MEAAAIDTVWVVVAGCLVLGRVPVVTNLLGIFGVIGATIVARLLLGTLDIGMMGNGAFAGLGTIAGPCGFVAPWGGAVIGLAAGSLVVLVVLGVGHVDGGAPGRARGPRRRRRARAARLAARRLGALAAFTPGARHRRAPHVPLP